MIGRCYDPSDYNYRMYGKLGLTVDKKWFSLSNYIKDVKKLDGFNRDKVVSGQLQLDKDKLQIGKLKHEKVYSNDTCCWLTPKENNPYNINHIKYTKKEEDQ